MSTGMRWTSTGVILILTLHEKRCSRTAMERMKNQKENRKNLQYLGQNIWLQKSVSEGYYFISLLAHCIIMTINVNIFYAATFMHFAHNFSSHSEAFVSPF